MPKSKTISKITDLTPDAQNVNRGTERGGYMLEHSLSRYGAGRSIVVDREGRVIAGNKMLEQAADMGLPIEVVQSDGHKLVVVQRTDLDLTEKGGKARGLAIADNRASEVGYEVDAEMLGLHALDMDLSGLYREDELSRILEIVIGPDEFREFTEGIAGEIEVIKCPNCGHNFPK